MGTRVAGYGSGDGLDRGIWEGKVVRSRVGTTDKQTAGWDGGGRCGERERERGRKEKGRGSELDVIWAEIGIGT